MVGRSVAARLFDILDAGRVLHDALHGKAREAFLSSRILRAGVERELEIISEATRNLPPEILARWPGIPWDDIRGFGDVARHAYHRVDPEIVWQIASLELEPLIEAIRIEAPTYGLTIDPGRSDILHFEDFEPGAVVTYGAYRLTAEEIIAFAKEYDSQPFHLDEEAGKASMLGGLAASGWHACAILMRLNCDGFLNRSTSMGAPGIDEVKWLMPLRPDVTLGVRRTVVETRASKSRPEMGLVKFLFELTTERGEVVMTQLGSIMFGRREA